MIAATQQPKVEKILLKDDGTFPNNESLPLIIYRGAFEHETDPSFIEKTFSKNNWIHPWRDGIYDYHHYHSAAHEVLGIYKGNAMVQFGGPQGMQVELNDGDVVVIPAGVAHKCIQSSRDFKCIGAYPKGQDYDINYGKSSERVNKDNDIRKVPLPQADPVYGVNGLLTDLWSDSPVTVSNEVSKERAYRKELEHQLEESFRVKNIFTGLRETYRRTFFDKWVAGGMAFLSEMLFYLLFIAFSFFTIFVMINDPLTAALNDYVSATFTLSPENSAATIMFIKGALVLFSVFLLCVAMMLRGIRIRNRCIDNLIAEINEDIQSEEEREESIKRVL